jgi:ketosteroid isomerase-like protein
MPAKQWSMRFSLRNVLCVSLFACLSAMAVARAQQPSPPPATPAAEALHNELRALKDRAVAAVNKRDADALMKELGPNIIFTAMNNEVVRGIDQARAYHQRMLVGSGRVLEDMSLKVEADDLTTLYANGTIGVAAGTSVAHFKLATGNEFDIPLRWTATLNRADGKWAIVGMHFSANVFDNPILDGLKWSTKWIAIASGVVALLIGFLVGRWTRRKPA